MRSLDQLDAWLAGKIKAWSSSATGLPKSKEVLELRREILDNVRNQIQPAGAGRMVFPYNTISIRVAVADTGHQNLVETALGDDGVLESEIKDLLKHASCPVPPGLTVSVTAVEDPDLALTGSPLQIEYTNSRQTNPPETVQTATRPEATLKIIRGEGEPHELRIQSNRVNIGRLREVVGEKEGLRRRNDIAFAETETTVSREHAHIRFDSAAGSFRLYDSSSQRGTLIFRDGRRVTVPKDPTFGIQLRSGDEILLGDARVAFETDEK